MRRGFTLIELLVVIAMIGVLSTTLIILIDPKFQIQRANDGKRKAQLKQIQAGLELYRSDVGGYPIDDSADGSANDVKNSGNSLVNPTDNTIVYLQSVPLDPKSSDHYYYCTQTSCGAPTSCTSPGPCSSYALYACSEQQARDAEAVTPLPTGMSCAALGTAYYYKVLSP